MDVTILSLVLLLPLLMLFSTPLFNNISTSYKWVKSGVYFSLVASLAGIIWFFMNKSAELNFFTYYNIGFTIRLDSLSLLMYSMISVIALVVVRFSRNYLDGEINHKQFISKLAFTIAFVQLLVISGNLATIFIAWVGTSLGLQRLLIFYPERKKARLAARKKFIVARLGDLTLLSAFILIYHHIGSGNLTDIFNQIKTYTNLPLEMEIAGILLVISAGLKSVQVPFHGWLLDVMETPTPVSALLHAGLINAGPFLIIRFAYMIDLTSTATIILVIVGALSALFGAIAATTQPTIKTALAYSSIGHMGFTLMICGLGVYSASLLHLVAHSFYKAYAFLSSASLIDKVQTSYADNYKRLNNTWRILAGVLSATVLFLLITYLWKLNYHIDFQMIIIASIIFLGILSLHINSLDTNNSKRSLLYLLLGSVIVINSFFLLEQFFAGYLHNQIPEVRNPGFVLQTIGITILFFFFITAVSLSWSSKVAGTKIFWKLKIHFRNGLYINQISDKFMNSLSLKTLK